MAAVAVREEEKSKNRELDGSAVKADFARALMTQVQALRGEAPPMQDRARSERPPR